MNKRFMAVTTAVLFAGAASAHAGEAGGREVATYLSNVLAGGLGLLILADKAARLLAPREPKRLGQPESSRSPQRRAPTFGDRSPAASGRGRHVGSMHSR